MTMVRKFDFIFIFLVVVHIVRKVFPSFYERSQGALKIIGRKIRIIAKFVFSSNNTGHIFGRYWHISVTELGRKINDDSLYQGHLCNRTVFSGPGSNLDIELLQFDTLYFLILLERQSYVKL